MGDKDNPAAAAAAAAAGGGGGGGGKSTSRGSGGKNRIGKIACTKNSGYSRRGSESNI